MESDEDLRKSLLKELHAAGQAVPPPHGPFTHLDLHHLAVVHFSVDSLAKLTTSQLSDLITEVMNAQTSDETRRALATEIEGTGTRKPSGLALKRLRTSDEMGQ
jgi:hypothetical protein